MHNHDKDVQHLVHRLMANLNDWIETYDIDTEKEQEMHSSCRDGYIIMRDVLQKISLLLEKDNCA